MSDFTHPRERFGLLGLEAPETAIADAMTRGRMHHAWLLCGPQGIGKASFAYRLARRLLGAAADPEDGALGSRTQDPVSRQVAARSHPDLMVLDREAEGVARRKSIPVKEVRALAEFFSRSPAQAAWRVAIIDSLDDLASEGANALLKTLEEPPDRAVLLLVSHAPGGLLPTLRSRCRRLNFPVPTPDQALQIVMETSGADQQAAEAALSLADGLPGAALAFLGQDGREMDDLAARVAVGGLAANAPDAFFLADQFRGAEGARRFELFFHRLQEHLRRQGRSQAASGALEAADQSARLWQLAGDISAQVEGLNLDKADALFRFLAEPRVA